MTTPLVLSMKWGLRQAGQLTVSNRERLVGCCTNTSTSAPVSGHRNVIGESIISLRFGLEK